MVTFWSLGHAPLVCQVLSPEATLVFEVQGGKKASMLNIVDVQWMINRPTYHHTEL